MKNKIKYLLGTLIMGSIFVYSTHHSEKYNVFIPIVFGVLTLISLTLLITELLENNK